VLKVGRHFRFDEHSKGIISRNHEENEYLMALHPEHTTLLTPLNFAGPTGLLIGEPSQKNIGSMTSLILRYGKKPLPPVCEIQRDRDGHVSRIETSHEASEECVESLRI